MRLRAAPVCGREGVLRGGARPTVHDGEDEPRSIIGEIAEQGSNGELIPKVLDFGISKFSLDVTEPNYALGYVFDIVLRGPEETPMESPK